jgi:hypothetical protein
MESRAEGPYERAVKRKSSKGAVSVKLDDDTIRNIAYDLSQKGLSWDDYVWLLAESELRLAPAYDSPRLTPSSLAELGNVIQINPSNIMRQPSEDDIRDLAGKIAQASPRMDELHWFIAERNFIFEQACGENPYQ